MEDVIGVLYSDSHPATNAAPLARLPGVPNVAQAELAWEPISDESVATLQLRATTGPDYEAEDEAIVTTFPATAAPTWTGHWDLSVPGAAATFKLYSLTPEGNERGSNPITVTRPF